MCVQTSCTAAVYSWQLECTASQFLTLAVQFLRSLRHRNIVYFYGAGDLATAPFLVTEFMERGSLCDLLASREPLHRTR